MLNSIKFIIVFIFQYLQQKRFIQKNISPLLQKYKTSKSKDISAQDIYKIEHYYGLGSVILVGEAVAQLHGKKLSFNERLSATLLASLTGIFDDFFDKNELNETEIKNLLHNFNAIQPPNIKQKLAVEFYQKALQLNQHPQKIETAAWQVFEAQKNSLNQKNPDLSFNELLQLSNQKGASSMLLYRSVLSFPIAKNEEEILKISGEFFQLCNDIFDVYKDLQEGINTSILNCKNVQQIQQLVQNNYTQLQQALRQSNFTLQQQKKYNNYIHVVLARTMVSINQYQKHEKNSLLQYHQLTRKQLITDFALFKNQYLFIQFYFRLNRLKSDKSIPFENA